MLRAGYIDSMSHVCQETLFDLEEIYKPQRPLCSNQKDGSYKRRSRSDALDYAYIETNPLCVQSLIVADVDHGDYWAFEKYDLPAPTWRASTLFADSYHAVWALRDPVCLTDAAHRPPVNLLARVETGLRRAVEADTSYGGRITKNPLNVAHTTTWGVNNETNADSLQAYGLKELAAALDYAHLLPKLYERDALINSGVGRNVTLFDLTRNWAYRAIKRYWGDSYTEWEETVFAYVTNKNLSVIADDWGSPLPQQEVKYLSKSIAKWVWRKFTPERFAQIQAARGTVRALQLWAQKQHNAAQTLELLGIEL